MKSQTVRLADVYLIAPFMIYAAGKLKGNNQKIMLALGFATLIYNGLNFIKYEKAI